MSGYHNRWYAKPWHEWLCLLWLIKNVYTLLNVNFFRCAKFSKFFAALKFSVLHSYLRSEREASCKKTTLYQSGSIPFTNTWMGMNNCAFFNYRKYIYTLHLHVSEARGHHSECQNYYNIFIYRQSIWWLLYVVSSWS